MREGKCPPGDTCIACNRLGYHLEPVENSEVPETLRDQLIEFHKVFCPDQGIGEGSPTIPSVEVIRLRLKLITEEYFEALGSILPFSLNGFGHELLDFQRHAQNRLTLARATIEDAINQWGGNAVDIVELADALADLDYVVEGTRIAFNINGKPIANEVHRSNMSKIGGHRREDGKWIKPNTYSPADIRGELNKQGWNDGKR
jgi:predicted HAD superfamily Cof-like phosphohydrolase